MATLPRMQVLHPTLCFPETHVKEKVGQRKMPETHPLTADLFSLRVHLPYSLVL